MSVLAKVSFVGRMLPMAMDTRWVLATGILYSRYGNHPLFHWYAVWIRNCGLLIPGFRVLYKIWSWWRKNSQNCFWERTCLAEGKEFLRRWHSQMPSQILLVSNMETLYVMSIMEDVTILMSHVPYLDSGTLFFRSLLVVICFTGWIFRMQLQSLENKDGSSLCQWTGKRGGRRRSIGSYVWPITLLSLFLLSRTLTGWIWRYYYPSLCKPKTNGHPWVESICMR